MKEQLTELLNTLYEAEGLVEMALRRRAQASDRVTRLVVDKCCDVARLAASIELPDEESDITAGQAEAPLYADAPEPAAPQTASLTDEAAEEEDAVEVFTNEVLPKATAFAQAADINDASIFDNDDTPAAISDYKPSDVKEAPQAAPSEEMLKPSKPLIGFFSINDKFRFRRELFANSDTEMRECLTNIESLADADSAHRYCYSLGWDPESRDVKDFLIITDRYFNS